MDLRLDGKRAIVTGGSRGIGRAVAEALVAEGVAVALLARDPAVLRQVATELGQSGGTALPIAADTTDDASVRAAVGRVAVELGGIDILVNAAARPAQLVRPAGLLDIRDDDLRAEFESKVLGYLRCARAVAPGMIAQGWGRIISVSGLNARQTGSTVGSIRNVAVAAMTKNLADELGPAGINVTLVHPGITVTERTPASVRARAEREGISEAAALAAMASRSSIGRLVTAAEVADVVTFLASPRSVAVNGDAVPVGGGATGSIHY